MTNNYYSDFESIKRLISVDCVIFGYDDEQLKLLVFKRIIEPSKGKWSLLGGWVKNDESSEEAAHRVLHHLTGLKYIYQEQVETFSKPGRDPGGNVITVEYYALIKIDEFTNQLISDYGAKWFALKDLPSLIFDHDILVVKALDKLRLKASYELFGKHLLPEKFTILKLRKLYNEIYQKEFDPANFRKKVLSLNVLERLEEKDKTESRKGAYLYRFKDVPEMEISGPVFRKSFVKK
ncbi:NUDIX hydrolase [Plebeiibacterium marinum]|uniref:NUDIX domain-containing protein n=1 Tax=Plebeiibacterium marinum TaxID=2992111 RepID=A0AAE3MFK7_9BACT|nr:NUDIX domain-containing protein [Plebeiobacterium marinum]MCW3806661.1 NUDIX domain-containing protein [Plebeiobacterium marinum]